MRSHKKPSKMPKSGASNETQFEQNRETVARLIGRILAKDFMHQHGVAEDPPSQNNPQEESMEKNIEFV